VADTLREQIIRARTPRPTAVERDRHRLLDLIQDDVTDIALTVSREVLRGA
jgi:hypothetical protein